MWSSDEGSGIEQSDLPVRINQIEILMRMSEDHDVCVPEGTSPKKKPGIGEMVFISMRDEDTMRDFRRLFFYKGFSGII